jgi:hypothetical protein
LVLRIRSIRGPITKDAVHGAGLGVARNRLGQVRARFAAVRAVLRDLADLRAGAGTATARALGGKHAGIHGSESGTEEGIVVRLVGLVEHPTGDLAVDRAGLGVARDRLRECWAGLAAVLRSNKDYTLLFANSRTARD